MSRPPAKTFIGILILAAAIILPLFMRNPYLLTIFIVAVYFYYASQCWNLVFGYAGQFSLCHQVFLKMRAYTSTMLRRSGE